MDLGAGWAFVGFRFSHFFFTSAISFVETVLIKIREVQKQLLRKAGLKTHQFNLYKEQKFMTEKNLILYCREL